MHDITKAATVFTFGAIALSELYVIWQLAKRSGTVYIERDARDTGETQRARNRRVNAI